MLPHKTLNVHSVYKLSCIVGLNIPNPALEIRLQKNSTINGTYRESLNIIDMSMGDNTNYTHQECQHISLHNFFFVPWLFNDDVS